MDQFVEKYSFIFSVLYEKKLLVMLPIILQTFIAGIYCITFNMTA